tara:strand:- start:55 stop:2025 length:1971 start_codon:yes stop_codon:yes gene_type:complete
MAQKTPIKAIYSGSTATGLGEFAASDTVDYSDGGTGLASLGSAGQVLKVNSGASALEYGNVEAVINIDGMTDGSAVTLHATQDKIPFSDNGTEKYFTPTTLATYLGSLSQTLTNKTLTSPVLNTGVSGTAVLDEDDLSTDSATQLATQQSIKAYVDSKTHLSLIDEDNMSTDSATRPPSQQSVKAYVDSTVTAEDLDVTSDSGTIDIDLDSETLTIAGGSGIDTSASSTTITIAGEDASTSNKGVASFSSSDFSVSSGAVTVKSSGITSTQLAGSIANAKLANSTITVADGSSTTAVALGGTITFAGTSNEVEVGESSGTITIGLPDDVTIAGDLTVSGDTTTVNTATLSVEDPLIIMASGNNSADAVDIGFYGLYDTSGSQDLYAGLFRDAGDSGKWKLFKDNQAAPTTTVNVSGTGYAVATLVADLEGDVTGDVTGNADTATALAAGRTIGMTGDVVWTSASFTGSGNVTGSATIQATSVEGSMLNNNVISGQTEITSGLADADELLYSDAGTVKRVGMDTLKTYFSALIGSTSVTTLGTIATGVWQGTAIASSYIAGDAIVASKIADDAIDSEHYTDGSIDNQHLAGSIANAKLANSSITLGDASSSIMTISLGQQFSVIGSNGCTTSLDNNILTINAEEATATGYAAALALG